MKKCRVVIFVSGNGTTTARTPFAYFSTEEWQAEIKRLQQRGFQILDSFNAPFVRYGMNKYYAYYVKWATRNLGI
jgi:hypothetical protein